MNYARGPTENKLRHMRREYITKVGVTGHTILVISPEMWDNYLKEGKLQARMALIDPDTFTFEGWTVVIDNTLPADVAYIAEETQDERSQREERFLHTHR